MTDAEAAARKLVEGWYDPKEAWSIQYPKLIACLVPVIEKLTDVSEELAANRACNLFTWKERAEAAEAERDACRNLVARLNGDGGHRQQEVGMQQAADEAEARVVEMMQVIAENRAEAEVARLTAVSGECHHKSEEFIALDLHHEMDCLREERDALSREEELKARLARLEEALRAVEWCDTCSVTDEAQCFLCTGLQRKGHAEGCAMRAALGEGT